MMLAGLGANHGRTVRWYENLLARYNRHVASLASAPDEARDQIYQEALQYQAALQVVHQIRKGQEPIWDNQKELDYYKDWKIGDPFFGELTVKD